MSIVTDLQISQIDNVWFNVWFKMSSLEGSTHTHSSSMLSVVSIRYRPRRHNNPATERSASDFAQQQQKNTIIAHTLLAMWVIFVVFRGPPFYNEHALV